MAKEKRIGVFFGDIATKSGKTIREENLEKGHNIPIDTLVEVKWDEWHGDGACRVVHARLWVVAHIRDCDGTPLYALADVKRKAWQGARRDLGKQLGDQLAGLETGFNEESLTVIEVTEALKRGEGALTVEDE